MALTSLSPILAVTVAAVTLLFQLLLILRGPTSEDFHTLEKHSQSLLRLVDQLNIEMRAAGTPSAVCKCVGGQEASATADDKEKAKENGNAEGEKKYYAQSGEDREMYERFFVGKRNLFFVEMGGLDGVTFSNTLFYEKFLDWRGVLIEPIPESFVKMRANRPLATCLHMAV